MLSRTSGTALLWLSVVRFAASHSIVRILSDLGAQDPIDGKNAICLKSFTPSRDTPAFNERHRASHVAAFEMVRLDEVSRQLDERPLRSLDVFPSQHQKSFDTGVRHRLDEPRPLNALHDRCALVIFFEFEYRTVRSEAIADKHGCDRFLPGWHGIAP